jgi:hypothetical protein
MPGQANGFQAHFLGKKGGTDTMLLRESKGEVHKIISSHFSMICFLAGAGGFQSSSPPSCLNKVN